MNASLGASTQDPSGTMLTPLMLKDKEQFVSEITRSLLSHQQ